MNSRGEAKPRNWIIGLLLFGLVMAGVMAMLSEMGTDLTGDTETYNSTFNRLDAIKGNTSALDDDLSSTSDSVGVLGFLNTMIGSAWSTMRLLFSSFGFMSDVFYATEGSFGIPTWVTGTIIAIISIIIVFAILRAILQTDQL